MLRILFSFEGRIGRRNFWLVFLIQVGLFAGFFGQMIYSMIEAGMEIQAIEASGSYLSDDEKVAIAQSALQVGMFQIAMMFIVCVLSIILYLTSYVKRLHDMNLSGWWVLTNFLASPLSLLILAVDLSLAPVSFFVSLIPFGMLLACGFFPGTRGPNNFGEDRLSIFDIGVRNDVGWEDRVKEHRESLRDVQVEAQEAKEEAAKPRKRRTQTPPGKGRKGFGKRGIA